MKKYLLLLIGIFFLTGCNVEYNLEIGSSIKEETSIVETNQNNWNKDIDGMPMKEATNYQLSAPLPLLESQLEYGQSEDEENASKINGISYYNVSSLNNSSQIGLLVTGNFTENYNESNVVLFGLEDFEVIDDDTIEISASGFKMFESYETLDNIKINIKTNYEVTDNNADQISGNTYTWNIDKSNYQTKNIHIKANKPIYEKVKQNVKEKVDNVQHKGLVITVIILMIAMILVYIYFKRKKNDSF